MPGSLMNPVHHVHAPAGRRRHLKLSLREIPHVIALAMAPAFLLGVVAALSALVAGKVTSIVMGIRTLNTIEDADRVRAHLKADIPRLKRCAKLVGRSLVFLVGAGFVTASLMVLAFIGALMKWQHETAVAVLFVIALALLAAAFGYLLCEALIWHHEFDHQA
jgi:Protein of unknown function (DUF2721)